MYVPSIISFGDCYSVAASALRFSFFVPFIGWNLIRLWQGFKYLIFLKITFKIFDVINWGKKMFVVHILPDISRSYGNHTIKFGQSIE